MKHPWKWIDREDHNDCYIEVPFIHLLWNNMSMRWNLLKAYTCVAPVWPLSFVLCYCILHELCIECVRSHRTINKFTPEFVELETNLFKGYLTVTNGLKWVFKPIFIQNINPYDDILIYNHDNHVISMPHFLLYIFFRQYFIITFQF